MAQSRPPAPAARVVVFWTLLVTGAASVCRDGPPSHTPRASVGPETSEPSQRKVAQVGHKARVSPPFASAVGTGQVEQEASAQRRQT